MAKIFILFFFTCSLTCNLFGSEINWAKDYDTAIKQAKKEHKRVMLLITSETCKWCRKLEATTLKDFKVVDRLNRDYISIEVTRNKDEYPTQFMAKVVPITYFLDNDEEVIMRGVMGYWSSEDYLSIMDDVDRYYKRKLK